MGRVLLRCFTKGPRGPPLGPASSAAISHNDIPPTHLKSTGSLGTATSVPGFCPLLEAANPVDQAIPPIFSALSRSDSQEEVLQCASNVHDDHRSSRWSPPPSLHILLCIQYPRHTLPVTWIYLLKTHHHAGGGGKFETCLEGPRRRHPIRSAAVPQNLYEQLPGLYLVCHPLTGPAKPVLAEYS